MKIIKHTRAATLAGLLALALSGAAAADAWQNPRSMLSAADLDYYDQSFSYAMETLDNDKIYEWRTERGEGQLRAGKEFTSTSGKRCRPYAENFIINKQDGQFRGYACLRGEGDGWCKLSENDTLTCDFEASVGMIGRSIDSANRAQNKARGYKNQAESSFWDWWPF